jgi:amino acid adenylation domain-containing protein
MKPETSAHQTASILDAQGAGDPSGPRGVPRLLELPTDRPRRAAGASVQSESLALTPDPALAVEWFSGGQDDENRPAPLLAAFAVLLHRYSGDTVIEIGILPATEAGNGQAGPAESVSTAQPLWIDLSGDPEFRELEGRVRRTWHDARAGRGRDCDGVRQNDPSEDIEATLPPFQVLFGFSSAPPIGHGTLNAGEGGSRRGRMTGAAELALHVTACGGSLGFTLEYDACLFDEETVRRMLGHYQVLLQAIVANPEARISTVSLLTEAESRTIEDWSQPAKVAPASPASGPFYHEAFTAQAATTPDAIAVVCDERQLTYKELDVQSNQVAHYLRRHGVGPDVLVGICLERSPELVAGLLSILKAGGAYVPLEPSYPPAQLSALVAETRPAVLITQSPLLARLPRGVATTICLDTERAAIAAESSAAPDVGVNDENLATVMFSSGSTGKPKAIARAHRSHRFGPWIRSTFQLGESDRHVLKTSLDSSLLFVEVFWALLTGGRMIIAGPQAGNDTAALLKLLIEQRVSLLGLVPSLLRMLVAEAGLEACTSLRHVICFGESLPADVEAQCCRRLPAALSVFYGTTESPALALRQCHGGDRPLGNLGYRLGNRLVYVLDKGLRPAPIGVPGELVGGGPSLSAGYLNAPAQTAERFIPDPFSKVPGARLFRTGDRARWRSDGSLEFLGRLDHQIKIRGYRVEPAEVEAALVRHPGVREAVVVARQNRDGENHLVAYLVPGSRGPSVSELRAQLVQSLPAHMIPSRFVELERLPRRPNGKLDRGALPASTTGRPGRPADYLAPSKPAEQMLAGVWREVLGWHEVGVHDNFFELGGDSLLAVKLFARLEAVLDRRLPLATLLQAPTIAQLAEVLGREQWRPPWSALVAVQPRGQRPPFVCVHGLAGEVLEYRDLALHLGEDQPFYGFQAPVGQTGENLFWDIKTMAAAYVRELRQFQPTGPYYLGGLSFGGIVAFEMAQCLVADGETVALLALFDMGCPGHITLPGSFQRLREHGRNLARRRPGAWPAYLGEKFQSLRLRLRRRLWRLVHQIGGRQGMAHLPVDMPREMRGIIAMSTYSAQAYPGQLTLFRAAERIGGNARDPLMGWDQVELGGIVVEEVPGNHVTLIREPNVPTLAQRLRFHLELAQSGAELECQSAAALSVIGEKKQSIPGH